jgi:hypothetical protein
MLHAVSHIFTHLGHSHFGRERSAAKRFATGGWDGLRGTVTGNLVMAPIIGFQAALADRGEVLPTIVSEAAGVATYPFFSAITCGLLSAALPGFIGPFAASIGGMILAGEPDLWFVNRVNRAVRWTSALDRKITRIETGSRWKDSASAFEMRRAAVSDMSSAFGASRRFLGQESSYYHDF